MVTTHVIAQLDFSSHDQAAEFHAALKPQNLSHTDYGFGQDPQMKSLDVWSPTGSGGEIFGNRDIADDLTNTAALDRCTGAGVNVIIVDRGLSQAAVTTLAARMRKRRNLPPAHGAELELLGWTRYDYSTGKVAGAKRMVPREIRPGTTGSDHAHMIARNVLAIAPDARIWDAPLLPLENEQDAPPRLSDLGHLFHWINCTVKTRRGPWIMVNAWGVLNPSRMLSFIAMPTTLTTCL